MPSRRSSLLAGIRRPKPRDGVQDPRARASSRRSSLSRSPERFEDRRLEAIEKAGGSVKVLVVAPEASAVIYDL